MSIVRGCSPGAAAAFREWYLAQLAASDALLRRLQGSSGTGLVRGQLGRARGSCTSVHAMHTSCTAGRASRREREDKRCRLASRQAGRQAGIPHQSVPKAMHCFCVLTGRRVTTRLPSWLPPWSVWG